MTGEDTGPDVGAPVGAWTELVRRMRMGERRRPFKLAALAFASYADADGTSIHCGVARLALDCEIGHSTARRYVRLLGDLGLTEVTARGSRRLGRADEHRLILAVDLLDRLQKHGIVLPNPAEYRGMVQELAAANRRGRSRRPSAKQARSPLTQASGTTARPQDPSPLTLVSGNGRLYRSPGDPITARLGEPPPSPEHPSSGDLPSPVADPGRQPAGVARAREATASARPLGFPECPQCGVVLDPGGACFMCANGGHAIARSGVVHARP